MILRFLSWVGLGMTQGPERQTAAESLLTSEENDGAEAGTGEGNCMESGAGAEVIGGGAVEKNSNHCVILSQECKFDG